MRPTVMTIPGLLGIWLIDSLDSRMNRPKEDQRIEDLRRVIAEKDAIIAGQRANAQGYFAAAVLENAGVTLTSNALNPDMVPGLLTRQHDCYIAHAGHRAQEFDPRTSNIGVGVVSGLWNGSPALLTVLMFGSTPSRPPPRLFYRLGGREPETLLE